MHRRLPRYTDLVRSYPDKHEVPTKTLLDRIGGQVRRSLNDAVNTCAIRMSVCLNAAGDKIRRMPGLYQLTGAQAADARAANPDIYIVRAKEMKRYLDSRYGAGKPIYDATKDPTHIVGIKVATQGIIVFDWGGRPLDFGAGGHVDLFRLWPNGDKPPRLQPACAGECFWWPVGGPMTAYLWETAA